MHEAGIEGDTFEREPESQEKNSWIRRKKEMFSEMKELK